MTLRLDEHALPKAPARLAVAISGGGDSVALAHLAAEQAARRMHLVSVDHGLRDVTAELDLVAHHASLLDMPHTILRWRWDGRGNLQAEARNARRRLIAQWALAQGIGAVLLGHTHDDQAETILMRIARGSGIDGLAGMAAMVSVEGIDWCRPLLGFRRSELRDYLRARGLNWAEDPSNKDERFERVKVRHLLDSLQPLGMSSARLVQLGDHASAARITLRSAAREWVAANVEAAAGSLLMPKLVCALQSDTDRRVLSAAVQYIGGGEYRPRWKSLQGACVRLADEGQAPVAGCILRDTDDRLLISPDLAGLQSGQNSGHQSVSRGDASLRRLGIAGPSLAGKKIARLGAHRPPNSLDASANIPEPALRASIAIWSDGQLVGAPYLGYGAWSAQKPARMRAEFVELFDMR